MDFDGAVESASDSEYTSGYYNVGIDHRERSPLNNGHRPSGSSY